MQAPVIFRFHSKDRSEWFECDRYCDDQDITGVTKMNLDITNAPARTDSRIARARQTPSEEIAFTNGESTLGTVLVARSACGVCAILIGSAATDLTADLATQFPKSALVRDDRNLGGDLDKILRFIAAPAQGLALTLDIRGTPFQRRVWDALCA